MKANELMIGDLVITPAGIAKVLKIDGDNNTIVICQHDGRLNGGLVDEAEPIPLTPEILKKNGFITEEREGDPTFPYLAFIIENDEYRIEITWYDSHDVYEPNTGEYLHGAPEVWNMEISGKCGTYDCGKNKLHVHELQHALKLCGIKKTIEL